MKKFLIVTVFLTGLFINLEASFRGRECNFNARYLKHNGLIDVNKVNIHAITLTGNGTIKGSYTTIVCENYNMNGLVSGDEECTIRAQVLEGEAGASIIGKKVAIACDEFKFNGHIDSPMCVIYTKKAFDYSRFTRNKEGKYIIIIMSDQENLPN